MLRVKRLRPRYEVRASPPHFGSLRVVQLQTPKEWPGILAGESRETLKTRIGSLVPWFRIKTWSTNVNFKQAQLTMRTYSVGNTDVARLFVLIPIKDSHDTGAYVISVWGGEEAL